jgi:hypothetical protein
MTSICKKIIFMPNNVKLVFFFLFPMFAFGQKAIKVVSINPIYLPKDITYKGEILNTIKWIDNAGENVLILTETGGFHNDSSKYPDSSDAEIYAYHYLIKEKKSILTWDLYDYVKDCEFDIYAAYVKKTLQITDLDNNGIGEVWLVYKMTCSADVSPSTMKIILFEGDKKHVMSGTSKVQFPDNEYKGGVYAFDKTFYRAPKEFKAFAKELWIKNVLTAN